MFKIKKDLISIDKSWFDTQSIDKIKTLFSNGTKYFVDNKKWTYFYINFLEKDTIKNDSNYFAWEYIFWHNNNVSVLLNKEDFSKEKIEDNKISCQKAYFLIDYNSFGIHDNHIYIEIYLLYVWKSTNRWLIEEFLSKILSIEKKNIKVVRRFNTNEKDIIDILNSIKFITINQEWKAEHGTLENFLWVFKRSFIKLSKKKFLTKVHNLTKILSSNTRNNFYIEWSSSNIKDFLSPYEANEEFVKIENKNYSFEEFIKICTN